jgi:anti-anti-sigma regulatory factor
MSLDAVSDLVDEIRKKVKFKKKIEIKVEKITNFDVSSIQLLYSLKKSALNNNVEISFSVDIPDDIKHLLEYAGFNDLELKGNFDVL